MSTPSVVTLLLHHSFRFVLFSYVFQGALLLCVQVQVQRVIVSLYHTHTHLVGLPWTSDRLVAGSCTYTAHSQHTNIHAPSGNRTPDPSHRAAAALRHRPRGNRDLLFTCDSESTASPKKFIFPGVTPLIKVCAALPHVNCALEFGFVVAYEASLNLGSVCSVQVCRI